MSGGLSDVLQIRIQDGDRVLFEGTAESLSRKNVIAADDVLKIGERRTLTAYFHFPEETGNQAQDLTLSFDLCADAVQTKNQFPIAYLNDIVCSSAHLISDKTNCL